MKTVIILQLFVSYVQCWSQSQIQIDPDGGYTGIVIKIDKNVPEEQCPQILNNLKVRRDLAKVRQMERVDHAEGCLKLEM